MRVHVMKLLAGIVLSISSVSAFAEPVSISSYDGTGFSSNGPITHYGYYGGTATQEGGYSSNWNFSGGSGALNDGKLGSNTKDDAHMMLYETNGSITLHLGILSSISSLTLFSPEVTNNYWLGSIAGMNITINGETRYLASQGFGPANALSGRDHIHEYFDLLGTGLENLITDTIILSGFVSDGLIAPNNMPSGKGFYLSEISIDGKPYLANTVSEPAGLMLLAGGLSGLGFTRRRKKSLG